MEMGTDKNIETISPEGEIYICPACGYKDGFHVSFKMIPDAVKAEIYLICPNCHSRFKLGWQVSIGGGDA
jgi:transcription initiation factor IIE alpha subunit